jgi:hypothetical protein
MKHDPNNNSPTPRADRLRRERLKRRSSPWPVMVGIALYFLCTVAGNVSRRMEPFPTGTTTNPCADCVSKWLGARDPCDEVRERLPDHDPRIQATSRSWEDRVNILYEPNVAGGYVDCEITPISTATSAEILRAGAFVLEEAEEQLEGKRRISLQREEERLTWQLPPDSAGSPWPLEGSLTLQARGWRTRWLRIRVEEHRLDMWEQRTADPGDGFGQPPWQR